MSMFEKELLASIEKLKTVPHGEKANEAAIRAYLHKNYFVRKLFSDRLKIAYKLGTFYGKVVLDYGCGSGIFLQSISNDIKSGIGVDLDIEIAKKIITAKNISLIQIEDENNIAKMSNIGIVTSFDVLEHVINLEPLLKTIKKTLSPNGTFIISGPTENFLYKIGRKIKDISTQGPLLAETEHVRNIFDIKKTVINEGFDLQKDVNLWNLFHIISFRKQDSISKKI